MRIVQLANLVTGTSGGIRTVLDRLGRGYAAAGHDVHRIVPAAHVAAEVTAAGVVHHLPGVTLPASGGYRLLLARGPVVDLLRQLAPDRIEVSDRFTLTWVGDWARERGIPVLVMVHERLVETLRTWVPGGVGVGPVARAADRRLPEHFDRVVVPSRFAAAAFVPAGNVEVVPLGVDLATFRPGRAAEEPVLPRTHDVRLVAVTRLSREKRPELAVATLEALRRRGVDAELHLVGDGPQRVRLERRAAGLPVTFHGFVDRRSHVAALLDTADVALATCGIETFGLSALEALACGTPVVASSGGALAELVVGAVGAVAVPEPAMMAGAVARVLERDRRRLSVAARARAERYPWRRVVDRMLCLHRGTGEEVDTSWPRHGVEWGSEPGVESREAVW